MMNNLKRTRFLLLLVVASFGVMLSFEARVRAQEATTPIAYGQTVTGELGPAQPAALYIFSAQQGDMITVTMESPDNSLDSFVILLDQAMQNVLAVDNDSGGSHNARLRYVIQNPGNYVIKATTAQGNLQARGQYKLMLLLNNPTPTPSPGANAPRIAPIEPGQAIQADLNDVVGFHLYSLSASSGDPLIFTLEMANDLPVGMYLYTADLGERIGIAEHGQRLDIVTPYSGQYFLVVARAANSGSGTYTLRQVSGAAEVSLAPGQTVYNAVSDANPVHAYSLQGQAGQIINVKLRRMSGDLAVYVYLIATDSGKVLASANGTDGVALLTATLPADGTYAIAASREGQSNGTTQGNYALSLAPTGSTWQDWPVPDVFAAYTTFGYGSKISGTIDATHYSAPFRFLAEAGDVIQATMMARGGLAPYLMLKNANGDMLAQGTDRLEARIAQTGYYALIASRADMANGTTSGQFDLELMALDPAKAAPVSSQSGATKLIAGQPQTGTIGPAFADLFSFDGQAGMSVRLDLDAPPELPLSLILADADFRQLGVGTSSIPAATLPRTGLYYVFVVRRNGPNEPSTGTFNLVLQGSANPAATAEPVSLIYGQSVTGQLTADAFERRYMLVAHAGDGLIITLNAAPGSSLDPMILLLDPNGTLLTFNDDRATGIKDSTLAYEVPRDGRYTVVATRSGEASGTTTGDYLLKVDRRQAGSSPGATPGSPGPAIIPIRYGSTVDGTISGEHFAYYYGFDGTQGDVISISMKQISGTLEPVLYLYSYSGPPTLIASSAEAAITQFGLPTTGPYLIVATRAGAAQGKSEGNFILMLTRQK